MDYEAFVAKCVWACKSKHGALASEINRCSKDCANIARHYRNRDARFERIQHHAEVEAEAALARMGPARHSVCSAAPVLVNTTHSELVPATHNKPWRYFSVLDCHRGEELCITFKNGAHGPAIHAATSSDGLQLRPA